MSDPAVQVAAEGMSYSGVSILGGLGLLALWAFREALSLAFSWVRLRLFGPPATAVGASSSSATHDAVSAKKPATDSFENRPMIEDHFFFVTVDELLARRVPSLTCGKGNEVRSELLRDMMVEYLCAWKDMFTEFCNNEISREGFESRGRAHASGFSNRVSTMLLDLQNEITDRWMRRGVPLQAVTAFHRWDAKLVETLTNHSERIAQSAFFPTNRERLVALLTQHATFLATLLLEARYVLRRMNGGLDNVQYGRGIIGPIVGHDDDGHPPADGDDGAGGISAPRPKTPSGQGQALTKKQRSGEWREKKPSGSEIRLRPVIPVDDDESGDGKHR